VFFYRDKLKNNQLVFFLLIILLTLNDKNSSSSKNNNNYNSSMNGNVDDEKEVNNDMTIDKNAIDTCNGVHLHLMNTWTRYSRNDSWMFIIMKG
jgi:hypothetical protein